MAELGGRALVFQLDVAEAQAVDAAAAAATALNTPHFSVVAHVPAAPPKTGAALFQPELAARAIAFAAEHLRRELWVAGSTVRALLGNKLAPDEAHARATGFIASRPPRVRS